MRHKLLIFSIITAMIYLLFFSYILIFKYDSFDIPNHAFLNIKELKQPGAIEEYKEWDFNREKSEWKKDMDILYGLGAIMPTFVLAMLAENLLIRSHKSYFHLINKKTYIVSLINIVLIFILYYAVLYFNDYFRLYIRLIPPLVIAIDILILSVILGKKIKVK